MKTTLIPFPFFRNLVLPFIVLFLHFGLYGQNINSAQSATDNIRTSVNVIKEKANLTYGYAQQIYNAAALPEAQISAKQTLILLEDIKSIIQTAQTSLNSLLTQENMDKSGKYLNTIASDLIDLQNKTEWGIHKANKIIATNDFDNVKTSATAIMTETKKINTIVAESINHIALTDQRLSSID